MKQEPLYSLQDGKGAVLHADLPPEDTKPRGSFSEARRYKLSDLMRWYRSHL